MKRSPSQPCYESRDGAAIIHGGAILEFQVRHFDPWLVTLCDRIPNLRNCRIGLVNGISEGTPVKIWVRELSLRNIKPVITLNEEC
jgi:hypothetical protein